MCVWGGSLFLLSISRKSTYRSSPTRQDTLLENEAGGAQDTGDGVDRSVQDIAPDDMGCEWVWVSQPEGVGDIVPCVLER